MINITQCRIDQECKHLIVDAEVDNLTYYDNIYIDSVIIDTQKTYTADYPSSNPVFTRSYSYDNPAVYTIEENSHVNTDENCKCGNVYSSKAEGVKKVSLILDSQDLVGADINNDIFIVYIVASGVPSYTTPCGMDKSFVCSVAVNLKPIYMQAMNYIKELDSECTIPRSFIDMILKLKAFELSLKTGNYQMAFKQWSKLLFNKTKTVSVKNCGCNGTN